MILKDKFLIQSAFDSRRKLQKLLQGPRVSLGETLTPASTDFHNRDHERETRAQERERQKKTRHAQVSATFVSHSQSHPAGSAQPASNDTKSCTC